MPAFEERLESLTCPNAAVRLLAGPNCSRHIASVLPNLHWLPVCFHTLIKGLFFIIKTLSDLGQVI